MKREKAFDNTAAHNHGRIFMYSSFKCSAFSTCTAKRCVLFGRVHRPYYPNEKQTALELPVVK